MAGVPGEGWTSGASLLQRTRGPRGFLMLALLATLLCWSLGLLLAPDKKRFLSSPEWHYQPFYLAAHIVTLQLFVLVYRLNFNAGINNLDLGADAASAHIERVFNPVTFALAAVVAAPFCTLDYFYLYSDRYQKMGQDGAVRAIDLLMWLIWCAEWYVNALIWIVLVGFLIKNSIVIRRHRFKSPIEVVLHERHYRPFLRMSAQGASILFGFSVATVIYIWYTGGEITDYVGLVVTGLLLIIGFLTPWLLLKSKVDKAVHQEMFNLRQRLARDMQRSSEQRSRSPSATDFGTSQARSLEQRIDEVHGMLRITFLEQRHGTIGNTEAKAVLLRLMAPMVTIAWQARQHSTEIWNGLGMALQDLAKQLTRLGGGG